MRRKGKAWPSHSKPKKFTKKSPFEHFERITKEKDPEPTAFHLSKTLDEGLSDSPSPSPKAKKSVLDDDDTRNDKLLSVSRTVRRRSAPALSTSRGPTQPPDPARRHSLAAPLPPLARPPTPSFLPEESYVRGQHSQEALDTSPETFAACVILSFRAPNPPLERPESQADDKRLVARNMLSLPATNKNVVVLLDPESSDDEDYTDETWSIVESGLSYHRLGEE